LYNYSWGSSQVVMWYIVNGESQQVYKHDVCVIYLVSCCQDKKPENLQQTSQWTEGQSGFGPVLQHLNTDSCSIWSTSNSSLTARSRSHRSTSDRSASPRFTFDRFTSHKSTSDRSTSPRFTSDRWQIYCRGCVVMVVFFLFWVQNSRKSRTEFVLLLQAHLRSSAFIMSWPQKIRELTLDIITPALSTPHVFISLSVSRLDLAHCGPAHILLQHDKLFSPSFCSVFDSFCSLGSIPVLHGHRPWHIYLTDLHLKVLNLTDLHFKDLCLTDWCLSDLCLPDLRVTDLHLTDLHRSWVHLRDVCLTDVYTRPSSISLSPGSISHPPQSLHAGCLLLLNFHPAFFIFSSS